MYRRPPQPTVTSESGEDDSDEVIIDDSSRNFFLPSSLSSFGLSAISDDQENSLSRHHEPRHFLGSPPAMRSAQRRGEHPGMNLPIGESRTYQPLPAAGWDDFDPESFPPPPPPLDMLDIIPQREPALDQNDKQGIPESLMVQPIHGQYPHQVQPRNHLQRPQGVLKSTTQGDQVINLYSPQQLPPPPSPLQQYQQYQSQQQQQQQQPHMGGLANRTPLDVTKLSPWQRRKPHPQHNITTDTTTPFSALGLRWHKDTTYKPKSNTAPKDKENKKHSLGRKTSPGSKPLSRQGSSSRSVGSPDIVRGINDPWKLGQAEVSSPSLESQRDPMLSARDIANEAGLVVGKISPQQDQRLHASAGRDNQPSEARCPQSRDPTSPDILFSVDQGPFPFLQSRSTSSDESNSKRSSTARVKRKTKKKQKKKADGVDSEQSYQPEDNPKQNAQSKNQPLPFSQHQYFYPSPRTSPVPRLHRLENVPSQQHHEQKVTTQLLFDNPDALSHGDEENKMHNLNMMSFRPESDQDNLPRSNVNSFGTNMACLPRHKNAVDNVQTNDANINKANSKQSVIPSLSNIPPDSGDPSGYNFNSKANQVTKRESLPKNLQDLDISIRDEFDQIKKQYEKENEDESLSIVNANNVNKGKHSPKTSNKNSGYQSSGSSNGGGSIHKADRTSFKPSPCPSPGFLAFQNHHAQATESGKVSNTLHSAPEVFREYRLDLEHRPRDKLDDEDYMMGRKRCKKHVCFLVVVMLIVVVAAAVAVLALTLGVDVTKEIIASRTRPKYAVATANLTLKILNRNFSTELTQPDSQAYKHLVDSYTTELDKLFLKSNLSQVYCGGTVVSLREGSVYVTSLVTFLDEGLITSSKDVENVIKSAALSTNQSDDTIQLGDFIVCRSCVEAHLEFLSLRRKPQVLLYTIAYPIDKEEAAVDSVTEKEVKNKEKEASYNGTEQSIIYMEPSTTTSQPSFTTKPSSAMVESSSPSSSSAISVETTTTSTVDSTSEISVFHSPLTTTNSREEMTLETFSDTIISSTTPTTVKSPTTMTTQHASIESSTPSQTTVLVQMTKETTTAKEAIQVVSTSEEVANTLYTTPSTTDATKKTTLLNEETTHSVPAESSIGRIVDTTYDDTTTTNEPSTPMNTTPSTETTSPQQPATTSEQPTTTPEQTATTPEQPATTNERPATTPEQAATTPEQPATTNERPATAPEQPTTTVTSILTNITDNLITVDQTLPAAIETSTSSETHLPPTDTFPTTDASKLTTAKASDYASTSPKLDRVILTPTVITVPDVTTAITDDDVTVTCEIANLHDWTSVVMTHTPISQLDLNAPRNSTLVMLEPTAPYVTATVYSNRVNPTYDMTKSSIRLRATISDLDCSDYGIVECSLTSRTQPRAYGRGRLTITTPPTQPKLTAPVDAIENREVTPPIICSTQSVGYPHWTLSLQAVLLNSATPITVPTEALKFSNGKRCSNGVTLVLKGYLPVLAANGTKLVCQLQAPEPIDLETYASQSTDPSVSGETHPVRGETNERDSMSDEQTLMVIKESICHDKGRRSILIRHPYVCTRYIACEQQKATILSCPPEQCFDPLSGNCGVQAVFLEPIHGALHEGLAGLSCSAIHIKDWTRMRIRRHSWGAIYDDIVEVNPEGQVTWHDDSLRSRALTDFQSSASPLFAELYVWIYDLDCDDEDSYKCEVDREEEESLSGGHLLKVYARASNPVLSVPTTVVEGQVKGQLEVTCEATLGRPRGTLTLKRKFPHEIDFRAVSFTTTTMQDEGACLVHQKGFFEIPAEEVSTYNASQWVCHMAPSAGTLRYLGHQVASSEVQELYVVSDTICRSRSHHLLAHPVYGCEHFLHCGEMAQATVRTCTPGNCFNAITHWCDIPAAGPQKPCERMNGYLPHKSLCNKYINCHGGDETIEECPSGTVYATEGFCTADIHEAHCSPQIYGARSRS